MCRASLRFAESAALQRLVPLADSGQRAPCRSGPPLPGEGTCEVSRCHRSLRGGWSCGRGGRFWGDVGCILEEPRLRWVCWHDEPCSLLHCFITVCCCQTA